MIRPWEKIVSEWVQQQDYLRFLEREYFKERWAPGERYTSLRGSIRTARGDGERATVNPSWLLGGEREQV